MVKVPIELLVEIVKALDDVGFANVPQNRLDKAEELIQIIKNNYTEIKT